MQDPDRVFQTIKNKLSQFNAYNSLELVRQLIAINKVGEILKDMF
jgi:hypothetical protein